MAMETEAKFRVESHDPVRDRLGKLGAEYLGRVLETNRIFDRSDGSLRARGCGLRVRSAESQDEATRQATMTFKGPVARGRYKSRQELEVTVGDPEVASDMLIAMGFARILCYQKRRESWTLENCRIELDEPPRLGLFVEVEGPHEEAIRSVAAAIGLGDGPHVRESYVRMLMAHCHAHGVSDGVLRLDPSPGSGV